MSWPGASAFAATVVLALVGCVEVEEPPPGEILLPATDRDYTFPFTTALAGSGKQAVTRLAIAGNVGTVDLLGRSLPVLIYEFGPWPEIGVDVYQGLAVGRNYWYVVFAYCEGTQLDGVWIEGTDGQPMEWEPMTGSCSHTTQSTTRTISFPVVDMPYPVMEHGYTFSGGSLAYDGDNPGTVRLGAADMVLLPFEGVDCRDCPGGGPGGWWELHALFYDPTLHRACFGIFYMEPGVPDRVLLEYSLTLPNLAHIAGAAEFTATWTTP